jgi:hypothetical protein
MRPSQSSPRWGLALIAVAFALLAVPAATHAMPASDLRSPDAVDAGLTEITGTDLRSPDAADAAVGRTVVTTPQVDVVRVATDTGFDWIDAVVGFAAAAGLALLIIAGTLLARRRTGPMAA